MIAHHHHIGAVIGIVLGLAAAACTARADYMFEPGYQEAFAACRDKAAAIADVHDRYTEIGECLTARGYKPVVNFYVAGFPVKLNPLRDSGAKVAAQND